MKNLVSEKYLEILDSIEENAKNGIIALMKQNNTEKIDFYAHMAKKYFPDFDPEVDYYWDFDEIGEIEGYTPTDYFFQQLVECTFLDHHCRGWVLRGYKIELNNNKLSLDGVDFYQNDECGIEDSLNVREWGQLYNQVEKHFNEIAA